MNQLASTSEPVLNDLFLNQWVKVDKGGDILCNLVEVQEDGSRPVTSARVALIQDRKVVKLSDVEPDGRCSFSAVEPGNYSCVAIGSRAIAAFSLQVLDASLAPHLPSDLEIRVVSIDVTQTQFVLASLALPEDLIATPFNARTFTIDPLQEARRFAASSTVRLDDRGMVSGQLGVAGDSVRNAVIIVVKDKKEVARVSSDENGRFEVAGLQEGAYGLIAAGQNVFAALSFRVAKKVTVGNNPEDTRLVSLTQDICCPVLHCEVIECYDVMQNYHCIIPPQGSPDGDLARTEPAPSNRPPNGGDAGRDETPVNEYPEDFGNVNYAPSFGVPASGGFVAGGGGFGGGFVGASGFSGGGGGSPALTSNFGNLGGLLGIGALAVGLSALANEDDDGFDVPEATQVFR